MAKPRVQPTELRMHAFFSKKGVRCFNFQGADVEAQRCLSKAMRFSLQCGSFFVLASGLRISTPLEWRGQRLSLASKALRSRPLLGVITGSLSTQS